MHSCSPRLGRRRRVPRVDRLRRPPPIEGHRQGRRLLPREPIAAVVGGRPVGDGDADERRHAGRHDRSGLRDGPALHPVLLRPAARDDHPVADGGAVLHAGARLHRVRVSRTPLRRPDAVAGELSVPDRARVVARRHAGGAVGRDVGDSRLDAAGHGAGDLRADDCSTRRIGGVQAVAWTDVKQMFVVVGGMSAAVGILLYGILAARRLRRRRCTWPARPGG